MLPHMAFRIFTLQIENAECINNVFKGERTLLYSHIDICAHPYDKQ